MRCSRAALLLFLACSKKTPPPIPLSSDASAPAEIVTSAPAHTGRPFWTGIARMKNPPHPVPEGVANVSVHVPEGFDERQPLNIVLFLHGSEQCAQQLMQNGELTCKPGGARMFGAGLEAKHDDAGTQSILVIPQLAYLGGGTPGRFREKGYLPIFLKELLEETMVPGLGAPKTLEDIGSITLVAQSAGWIATSGLLDHLVMDDKITAVILIDAFFDGGLGSYARWLDRDRPGIKKKLVSVHAGWGNNLGNARRVAEHAKKRHTVVFDPPGSLTQAIKTNEVVMARWNLEHSWMPLLLLTKLIAGLDLPPRKVVPARVLWPGGVAAPASPIERGQELAGKLAWGDTLLANGALADDYSLNLLVGTTITVRTRAGLSDTEWGKLDVHTQIWKGDREVASDDDGGGEYDSRIELRAAETGVYTIRVSSSGQGQKRGAYSLKVE